MLGGMQVVPETLWQEFSALNTRSYLVIAGGKYGDALREEPA